MKRILLGILLIVLIAGVAYFGLQKTKQEETAPSYDIVPDSEIAPETVTFYGVSDEELTVTFLLDSVTVELSTLGNVTLKRVESGSNSLYTDENETITLWDRGDKVTVWQNGEVVFEGYSESPSLEENTQLRGLTWVWENSEISDGTRVSPTSPDAFSITFEEETVSGTTDCNGFGGSYKTRDDTISFGPFASTLMYCEGSEEQLFTSALADVDRFAIDANGKLLLFFKNEGGSMTFRVE